MYYVTMGMATCQLSKLCFKLTPSISQTLTCSRDFCKFHSLSERKNKGMPLENNANFQCFITVLLLKTTCISGSAIWTSPSKACTSKGLGDTQISQTNIKETFNLHLLPKTEQVRSQDIKFGAAKLSLEGQLSTNSAIKKKKLGITL